MLVPAYAGELTHAGHEFGVEGLVLLVELLALGIEKMLLMSLGHDGVQLKIERIVPIVTRAVTGIMADIEWRIAFGGFCQGRSIESIGVVGTVRFLRIGLDLFQHIHSLCV